MATTTTNFGWDIPQSTDLVKDGATAIAALGQDIDTAFVDFKGGTTGQVLKKSSATDLDVEWGSAGSSGLTLINTISFSAVSSAAFPNGTFSSTYDNYRLIINCTGSTGLTIQARLRVAGVDNTASVYVRQRLEAASSSVTTDSATTTLWDDFGRAATVLRTLSGDIFSPFTATPTTFTTTYTAGNSGAPFTTTVGNHSANTSFDSLNLICSSGNFTGTASMYGYAK